MADNPFYLGYKQDPKFEEPSKLYPGYFPGRPQPKPPLPRDFLGPTPDFGSVADEFGSVAFSLTGNVETFPKWIQEKVWDDFKQTLTPSIRPGDVSPEHLDDFDADTLPGAFGLSAGNPIDWITKPEKTLEKTLKKWGTTALSWNDLDTRARTHLWDQVLSDNPKYEFEGEAVAAAVLMDRTGRPYRVSASGANPFALRGSKIYATSDLKKQTTLSLGVDAATGKTIVKMRKAGEQIDVYDKVADSVIDFQRKSVSASSREAAYDNFVRDALDAVGTELNLPIYNAGIVADPNKRDALESFARRRSIAIDMQNIDFAYGGKSQLTSSIEKFALEGGGATKTVTINRISYTGDANVLDIHQKTAAFDKRIQDALDTLDKNLGTGGIGVTGLLDAIDPEEAARLRKFTQPYRQHLKDLQAANKQFLDAAQAGTLTRAQAITFYNKLDRVAKGGLKGRGASGGDLMVQGFEREMIRDMMDKEFMLPRSKGAQTRIGDIVDDISSPLNAKKLRPIASRLKYEREIYAIDEFVANVEQGRLLEVYVWRRMKNWMMGLTPDFYAKHVMKKLNYFGLIIDKDNEESFKNSLAYKATRGFGIGAIGSGGAPGRLFGNWFNLEHTGITDPRRRGFDPMMAGVRFSGKAWGGDHFAGVQGLHSIRALVTKGDWTPRGIMFLIENAHAGCFDDPKFIAKLLHANGKPITLPDGIKLDKFADQIVKFRDWVTANKDNFKVNGVAANVSDHVFWFALLDSLMKRERSGEALSMTRTFAGLLEKVWSNMNQFQTWILKKFGKYLAPLSYAKTIISEFIADLIPRLFSMLAGAVSGGVLSVAIEALGRALRPIIRYTVKKVLDFGQNFIGGLLHGDFYKAFAELEKQVVGFIRFATGVAAVPFLVIIFLTSGFFGSTLTTISPVDISKAEPFIPEGSANCTAPGNSCVISGGVDFCCPGSVCKNNVCFFCKGDGLPSLDDCSNCCSGICTGSPGSKVCTGDANRPPPPCEGCTAPPPAGNFGDGTNCLEGEFPVQCSLGNKGLEHPCIHPPHNGFAVDLQAPYDTPLFAPYDGESSPYNDGPEYGGSAIIFFPLDPSGDYQDDITSDCPAFYFSHMSYDGLVSGMVTKGTRIGLVSDTGNATGLPHAHTAADTDGAFPSGVGDVNINDLFHGWDPGNVKGYHCTTPWNPGADITCP